jgi:hypothetical protein
MHALIVSLCMMVALSCKIASLIITLAPLLFTSWPKSIWHFWNLFFAMRSLAFVLYRTTERLFCGSLFVPARPVSSSV